MRKWLLAALPLFWSCADNLLDPVTVTPELQAIDFPVVLVAGWPHALDFRVKAVLPETGAWSVTLRVTGPGASGAVRDYLLLDDGDYLALDAPGPGQGTHSGDNVAGDDWYTALIAPDFADGPGTYTLRARLMSGVTEEDFRQVTRDCVTNRAPEILSVAAPVSLPSGGSFVVTLRAADPDGQVDLNTPQLRQSGGVMRSWLFAAAGDSAWTVTVGPELAAGRQGPDTLQVVAPDRVGHETSASLVVELENGAPALDRNGFELWIWDAGLSTWLPHALADTIRLNVPAIDADFFELSIPISDPQTAADLDITEWSIARPETGMDQLIWYPLDDLGPGASDNDWIAADGRYSGGFQLPPGFTDFRVLRLRAIDRVAQEAVMQVWTIELIPPTLARSSTPTVAWRGEELWNR